MKAYLFPSKIRVLYEKAAKNRPTVYHKSEINNVGNFNGKCPAAKNLVLIYLLTY